MEIFAKQQKQQQSSQRISMKFNRFLVFRYSTIIFFFINIYWVILSFSQLSGWIILPIVLVLNDGRIIFEQTKKYWQPSNQLKRTKQGYAVQIGGNLCSILLVTLGKQQALFPFFSMAGRFLVLSLLILGIMVSLLLEWQVLRVEKNQDAYFKHLRVYEKNTRKER